MAAVSGCGFEGAFCGNSDPRRDGVAGKDIFW